MMMLLILISIVGPWMILQSLLLQCRCADETYFHESAPSFGDRAIPTVYQSHKTIFEPSCKFLLVPSISFPMQQPTVAASFYFPLSLRLGSEPSEHPETTI